MSRFIILTLCVAFLTFGTNAQDGLMSDSELMNDILIDDVALGAVPTSPVSPSFAEEYEFETQSPPPAGKPPATPTPTPGASPSAVPSLPVATANIPPLDIPPLPRAPPAIVADNTTNAGVLVGKQIEQANNLLTTLLGQISREEDWARSVQEIISNYQFRYAQVIADLRRRQDKIERVRNLILLLRKAKLHSELEHQLLHANDLLGQVPNGSPEYSTLSTRVNDLQSKLSTISPQVRAATLNMENNLNDSMDPGLPASTDSVDKLLHTVNRLKAKQEKAWKAKKQQAAGAPAATPAATTPAPAAASPAATTPAAATPAAASPAPVAAPART